MSKVRIHAELDRALKEAVTIDAQSQEVRIIIFSDHHRGRRDGADDFLPCEQTYLKALRHYLDCGHTLILLGDVEEFWENSIISVVDRYRNVLKLEAEFYKKKRLHRIWGNHDDAWQIGDMVRKKLGDLFGTIKVSESIVLRLKSGIKQAEILLVHGHQGNLESDRFAFISRVFVRLVWRNLQRLFRIPLSTPSNSITLKSAHDEAMYDWADKNDTLIICGHTHHPVFMSFTHADRLNYQLSEAERAQAAEPTKEGADEIALLRERLRIVEIDEGSTTRLKEKRRPLYFNSGCCSYGDGDITGLELADGEIRLVKWTPEDEGAKVLGATSIEYLLEDEEVDPAQMVERMGPHSSPLKPSS